MSAATRKSTALATGSSGSSTGSNNVVGWRRAMTGLLPTTLPSFNSRQSGYGCALMSPHPKKRQKALRRRCGRWRGRRERREVTSNLPSIMIDEPGMFDTLATWERFLAEVQSMPEFFQKKEVVKNAKWQTTQKPR